MHDSSSASLLGRTSKAPPKLSNIITKPVMKSPSFRTRGDQENNQEEEKDWDDLDDDYFERSYVPLSNLPTPPLSAHSNGSGRSIDEEFYETEEYLDPELIGPAVHLRNLIPPSTSLTPASMTLIQAILTRASLPLETIALAVAILDALNSRFAHQWRKSCPLTPSPYLFSVENLCDVNLHIDSISPEIIPISAMILAVKFLDDSQQTTKSYVRLWGHDLWSCEQVNFTQRCIMENLGHRLLPLWRETVIHGAMKDMQRAGRMGCLSVQRAIEKDWDIGFREDHLKSVMIDNVLGSNEMSENSLSMGNAVIGLGQQLTPDETICLNGIASSEPLDYFTGDDSMAEKGSWPEYVDPGSRIAF